MAEIEKINPTGLFSKTLLNDLRQIIDTARSHVAATAKYEVTMMYWNIGNRINRDVLNYERAEYGKQIVAQVARQLQEEYGTKGFDEKSIRSAASRHNIRGRWNCICVGWRNTKCNRAKKRRWDCYSAPKEVTSRSVCCN